MFPRLCLATLLMASSSWCAAATLVTTQTLESLLIERKFTAPVTAVAVNTSEISAEISARIEAIGARTGDIVNEGDLLATLDCRSYRNVLSSVTATSNSLKAQLTLAEQQLRRARSLRAQNNLSAEILDQRVAELAIVEANLEAQQAQEADAKLAVERCTVFAPYRAAVTARLVGEGTMATPGLPLFSLVGLDEVELSAQVPVDLTASMQNSPTLVFIDADQSTPVTVRNLSPVINAATGNREVRLTTADTLEPGASGRLEWYATNLVPANLLLRRDGVLGLFIASVSGSASTAVFHRLDSALEGRPARVDLPPGTAVIVEGRHTLSDGDTIQIESES